MENFEIINQEGYYDKEKMTISYNTYIPKGNHLYDFFIKNTTRTKNEVKQLKNSKGKLCGFLVWYRDFDSCNYSVAEGEPTAAKEILDVPLLPEDGKEWIAIIVVHEQRYDIFSTKILKGLGKLIESKSPLGNNGERKALSTKLIYDKIKSLKPPLLNNTEVVNEEPLTSQGGVLKPTIRE